MDKYYNKRDLVEPIEVDEAIEALTFNNLSKIPAWLMNFRNNGLLTIHRCDKYNYNKLEFGSLTGDYQPIYAYSTQIVFVKNGIVEVRDRGRFDLNYNKA